MAKDTLTIIDKRTNKIPIAFGLYPLIVLSPARRTCARSKSPEMTVAS